MDIQPPERCPPGVAAQPLSPRRAAPASAPAEKDAYRSLLALAHDPEDPLALAFAGVIARALAAGQCPLIRGLPPADFRRLLDTYFAGANLDNRDAESSACPHPAPLDELDDLLGLLMESRREASEPLTWLSHAIASAAMRDNHLWQDMGLPNRALLSRLMAECFPALAARNVGDMKWKKFFYRQLCERASVPICKSPNCADCVDYRICFAGEDEGSPGSDPAATGV